ncbi:hypothetical protein ACWEOH_06585 [Agromyces sp. NPDC004153]
MDQSIGRVAAPTTEAGAPDAPDTASTTDEPDAPTPPPGVLGRVRDLPPSGRYDDTGITDLDELQRAMDPLDPRKPGRENGDPLDPDGHVI